MKVILNASPTQKPLDKPQMVMRKSNEIVATNESANLPIPLAKANTELAIREVKKLNEEDVKVTEIADKKKSFKFKLPIALPGHNSLLISPIPDTKNDNVRLLIDSYSNKYREMYQMYKDVSFQGGIQLPQQDKLFFETVITKDSFKQYFTYPELSHEEVKQQINFVYFKSPTKKVDSDKVFKLHEFSHGYEFSLTKHAGNSLLIATQQYNEKPLREFLELSKNLRQDERVIIQFGFQPSESRWWKEAESRMKENKRVVRFGDNSRGKLGYPGFDCTLRLIVSTNDETRLESVARGYIMALKQLEYDNGLVERKVPDRKFEKWLESKVRQRKIIVPMRFAKRFILTQKEIAQFIKLPQRNLQRDFELDVSEKELTSVSRKLTGKKGILVGHSKVEGEDVPIKIPYRDLDDFSKTNILIGSPRCGKDTAAINYVVETVKALDCGAIIPDAINEHGRGMADMIRDALPANKVVDVNLGDFLYPVYLGLDSLIDEIGENGTNLIANNLIKVLELEDLQASKQIARTVFKAVNCNLYDAYCFFRSDTFAEKVYNQLLTTDKLLALQLKHDYFEGKSINQAKSAILSRLDDFFGNDLVKNMFAQEPNKRFDLRKLITDKKVVIIRCNKLELGELGTQVIVFLLTTIVFWLKKIMHYKQKDNLTLMVYNEFFQYMSKGLEETLSHMVVESPKFRLSFSFILHNSSQISQNLWNSLLSASANVFLFKNTNPSVYRNMYEQLKPYDVDTCMKTKRFESIFLPYIGGEQLKPIFVQMLLPVNKRQKMNDNSNLSRQHAIKYGTDIKIVKDCIYKREIEMYESKDDKETDQNEPQQQEEPPKPKRKRSRK